MGTELHGVTCYEGNVALFFAETADLVGVNVTLKEGDRAITARLTPEAWERLCDRYGGPMASIKCQATADECSPEVVVAMRARIEELESACRYSTQARDRLQTALTAAEKLAAERAPTFEQVEEIRRERSAAITARDSERERCAMQSEEINKLYARVKELEGLMQPNRATNGRRAMKLDDEPQTGPGVRGL